MLSAISMLVVLSLILTVVLVICFIKTYGVKMTAMWGGLLILSVVLEILMSLCFLFVIDEFYKERFVGSSKEREEVSVKLEHSLVEINRLIEGIGERTIERLKFHAGRISELQDWIDYLNEELEEVRQELGIEHKSEPQS